MTKIIFTKHALHRLKQRQISLSNAESVVHSPDKKIVGKKNKTFKFVKIIDGKSIQLVATFVDQDQAWLVISAWIRGEDDATPFIWSILTWPFIIFWKIIKILFITLFNLFLKKRK